MSTLSEEHSKRLLAPFGVPFLPEITVTSVAEVATALAGLDLPVAAKLCGDAVAHKSERGLLRLGLGDVAAVEIAVGELLAAARPEDRATGVLLAPMVGGLRELLVGVATDPVFGPTIALGVGGVLAEAIADVTIRLVPIVRSDALDMLRSLRAQALLGPFRGEPAVDVEAIVALLLAVSDATQAIDGLVALDLNPVRIVDGRPIALDALVEVDTVVGGVV